MTLSLGLFVVRWPVREMKSGLESGSQLLREGWRSDVQENCLTFEGYEKGELVTRLDFPEVGEGPSTPNICLDGE